MWVKRLMVAVAASSPSAAAAKIPAMELAQRVHASVVLDVDRRLECLGQPLAEWLAAERVERRVHIDEQAALRLHDPFNADTDRARALPAKQLATDPRHLG